MHKKPVHPLITAVFSFIFVLIIIALIIIAIQDRQTPLPVTSIVSNAGRVLVLRFPESSAPWEQFTAKPSYSDRDGTISVSRFPVGAIPAAPANTIRFAPEEWQPVATLLDEWCKNPPSYEVETDEPFYDIGLSCGYMRIKIPPDELPRELIQMIETVPSPTCDDPFCGWRE